MIYNYLLEDFPNNDCDCGSLTIEIQASNIIVSLSHINIEDNEVSIIFKSILSSIDKETLDIIISNHEAIIIIEKDQVMLDDELRDRSGKLRVHQTSRKIGTAICWFGEGDDQTDITKYGNGTNMDYYHQIGDDNYHKKYIDFNISENETWIHEGNLNWSNCDFDKISLSIVPRIVTLTPSAGSDITIYNNYLIIPTAPGSGTHVINEDLTNPFNGLVYIPKNDQGERSTGYWDAEYNETTHLYENVRPNYTGTGRFNIFSYEVTFSKFVRKFSLLDNGFMTLNSSDTDQIGQGMRFVFEYYTNTNIDDHNWKISVLLCLHRKKSI